MPTLPPVIIRIRSTCEPVLNAIKSVEPAPEVDCSVRLDEIAVPPITSGAVMLVVKVGVVASATTVPEPDVV
jgi:predicted ribosome-associated RNA-binding protein Tma20